MALGDIGAAVIDSVRVNNGSTTTRGEVEHAIGNFFCCLFQEASGNLLAATVSVFVFLPGCIPIVASTVISHSIATARDDKIIETLRRSYIVQRQADGKPDEQIAAEITKIDREWQIDLTLTRGDLMASTKPWQLRVSNCDPDLAEIQSEPIDPGCQERWKAQLLFLKEEGITLTPTEIYNWNGEFNP